MSNAYTILDLLGLPQIRGQILSVLKGRLQLFLQTLPSNKGTRFLQEHLDEVAEIALSNAVQAIGGSGGETFPSNEIARRIRENLRLWMKAHIKAASSLGLEEPVANRIADDTVELLFLLAADAGKEKIEAIAIDTGKRLAKNASDVLLKNLEERLSDFPAKAAMMEELGFLTTSSIEHFDRPERMKELLQSHGIEKACSFASDQIDRAIDQFDGSMSSFTGKKDITDFLHTINRDCFKQAAGARSLEDMEEILLTHAKARGKEIAAAQIQQKSRILFDKAGDALYDSLRKRGHGRGNRSFNRNLKNTIQNTASTIQNHLESNISAVFSGEKDIGQAAQDTALGAMQELAETKIQETTSSFVQRGTKEIAKSLHTSGKGSRRLNRHIDSIADSAANRMTDNLLANGMDVLSGRKELATAAKDMVVDTGKSVAMDYIQKHGDELIRETVKELSKQAEKRIRNELVKRTAVTTLQKLGNANAVINIAGTIYDIGSSVRLYAEGKITKAQLLRQIGEKGTGALVSAAFATVGTLALGPLGGAIGSLLGCLATNMLFDSVLSAFDAADRSKERYRQIKAACEESIREMRAQRERFERVTRELFDYRAKVIHENLDAIEVSIRCGNSDAFCRSLDNISRAFGKELGYKNAAEFDAFMMDKNAVFKL